jgi:flavin-dependent dehydrogenase
VETPLPFRGIGISRLRLDEAVLRRAEQSGAVLLRGRSISNVETQNGIRLKFSDGETMAPETLFLATGKHDLRGARRDAAMPEDLVGFKMYFTLAPSAAAELGEKIELILFRGGYAGLQMIEESQANLCLLADRRRLKAAGGRWEVLLNGLCRETPLLARLLDHGKPLLPQPLTIYRVPYGFIHRPRVHDPANLYRLGDQAGVIPSFTGDGMAIALHSAAVATSMFLRGADAAAYHRRMAKDIGEQISRARFFYGAANSRITKSVFLPLVKVFPMCLNVAANLTRVPIHARLLPRYVEQAPAKGEGRAGSASPVAPQRKRYALENRGGQNRPRHL